MLRSALPSCSDQSARWAQRRRMHCRQVQACACNLVNTRFELCATLSLHDFAEVHRRSRPCVALCLQENSNAEFIREGPRRYISSSPSELHALPDTPFPPNSTRLHRSCTYPMTRKGLSMTAPFPCSQNKSSSRRRRNFAGRSPVHQIMRQVFSYTCPHRQ